MYNIFIFLFYAVIKIASLFSKKAKDWIEGRKHIFRRLKTMEHGDGIIWIHCPSLGEYEQGMPLITRVKNKYPTYKILVTFFSPSGYNNRKDLPEVDYYYYLPSDNVVNALRFVSIVKPVAAIFIKYDFWYNLINALKDSEVPTFFVSCTFRRSQYFFRWYSGWFRHRLRKVTHYFVQNEESKRLLHKIRIDQVTITGDTRFDRVADIARSSFIDEKVEHFKDGKKLFIAGSSWEKDEMIIKASIESLDGYKLLIAPHVISPKNIERIKKLFDGRAKSYSEYSIEGDASTNVMILDCIGKLSFLYRYAEIAYIGGGFGKGIHNTLEAAVYGIPVIFGPEYKHFNEAVSLVESGGGYSITEAKEFKDVVEKLIDEKFYKSTKDICEHIVESNVGASDRIMLKISTLIR